MGLLPQERIRQGVKLITHFQLVLQVRIKRAIPLPPHPYFFTGMLMNNYTFTFT
jgi:hypothetical protein